MKKVWSFLKAFFAGFAAGLVMLGLIFYGKGSKAKERYQATDEVKEEIEKKSEEARVERENKVAATDARDIYDSLRESTKDSVRKSADSALERARQRSRQRVEEFRDSSGISSPQRD